MRRSNATPKSAVVSPLLLTAFVAVLTFPFVFPQKAKAQNRYVAFVHGISFGDDTDTPLSEKGKRWRKSGTIEAWEDAGVMGNGNYRVLSYYDEELYKETDQVMGRLVDQMLERSRSENPADADWLLVGHSQGGIVVRLLHKYLRENRPNISVEGVMAVASPLQGARTAEISWDGGGQYYSVSSQMTGFLQNIGAAPLAGLLEDGLFKANIQPYGGNRWVELSSNVFDVYEYATRKSIKGAVEADWLLDVDGKIDAISYDKDGAEAIAPGGDLIRQINNSPNPDQYRSLIGSERYPVPFRVASGAVTEEAFTSFPWFPLVDFAPIAGRLAEGKGFVSAATVLYGVGNVPELRPGEEPAMVGFYNNLVNQYSATMEFWDSKNSGWTAWYTCWNGTGVNPCNRQDRWYDGREALENFPSLYGELIDSYRLVQRTRTYEETVCPDNGTYRQAQNRFSPPSAEEWVEHKLEPPDGDGGGQGGQDDDDGAPGNECWTETVTEHYYVTVPDENDGIVSVQTGVWSEGDSPNDRVHNFLFDDDGGGQDDTGFNHAEMVYNRRRFSSSADPANYDASFQRGDLNPPMVNARNWAESAFESTR